jgi:hypothetical protein
MTSIKQQVTSPAQPTRLTTAAPWISAIAALVSAGVAVANIADDRTWQIIGMVLAGLCVFAGVAVIVRTGRGHKPVRPIVLALVGVLVGAAAMTGLAVRSSAASQASAAAKLRVTLREPEGVKAGIGFRLTGTLSDDLPSGTVLWPAVQPDSDKSGFYAQGRNCGKLDTNRTFVCDFILLARPGDWHVLLVLAGPDDVADYIGIRVNVSDCEARRPSCQPGGNFITRLRGEPVDGGSIAVRVP